MSDKTASSSKVRRGDGRRQRGNRTGFTTGACSAAAARAVVCWAAFSSAGAWAASVQVEVVDEAGRPVNGAVAFLESAAASA